MAKGQKPHTLAIDIGGTGIKMMVLDATGATLTEYLTKPTPHPATVESLTTVFQEMIKELNTPFDRVSAGYPGVVHQGVLHSAAHLDKSLINLNFRELLEKVCGKPAKVANDADVQGYGDIKGEGLEMVITLGTGVGSALFINGHLVPNLELGHHPFLEGKEYEDFLAKYAYDNIGLDKWRDNLKQAIDMWERIFNYDTLYLGGGLANLIDFELPDNVKISKNIEGVLGGIRLWEDE